MYYFKKRACYQKDRFLFNSCIYIMSLFIYFIVEAHSTESVYVQQKSQCNGAWKHFYYCKQHRAYDNAIQITYSQTAKKSYPLSTYAYYNYFLQRQQKFKLHDPFYTSNISKSSNTTTIVYFSLALSLSTRANSTAGAVQVEANLSERLGDRSHFRQERAAQTLTKV